MRYLFGTALALLMGVGTANAATASLFAPGTSSSQGGPNTGTNTANIYGSAYQGFNPANTTWSDNPFVSGGSVSGQYKSPFANTVDEGKFSYFSVGGGSGSPAGTPTQDVTLSLTKGFASAATLLWGSIDSYNSLDFFNGTTLVGSFTGSDINDLLSALPEYNGTNFEKVALLNFTGFGPGGFNSVVFHSTQAAFEFGLAGNSITTLGAVPIPAALPLFGTALGGLFFLKRRRRAPTAA